MSSGARTGTMPRSLFVTGTDTDIGKTLVSCALLHALGQAGWRCVGMKPIASGAVLRDGFWCNDDVMALRAAGNLTATDGVVPERLMHQVDLADTNPYLFQLPAAPHIAAQQEGRTMELAPILASFHRLEAGADVVVVEGVGGFRVPLNDDLDTADLAQHLNLPVVLVVGMRLGCISQALLTAEAIAARGLILAGWVANCGTSNIPDGQECMPHLAANIEALRQRLAAPLLGCLPRLPQATAAMAAQHLDVTGLCGA